MLSYMLFAALIILSLAILGCMYRLVKGPSMADRIMSLDTVGINLLAMIAILCMIQETRAYMDIILLIGILTFIGTTAFARYLERGAVLEHGDHVEDR